MGVGGSGACSRVLRALCEFKWILDLEVPEAEDNRVGTEM